MMRPILGNTITPGHDPWNDSEGMSERRPCLYGLRRDADWREDETDEQASRSVVASSLRVELFLSRLGSRSAFIVIPRSGTGGNRSFIGWLPCRPGRGFLPSL